MLSQDTKRKYQRLNWEVLFDPFMEKWLSEYDILILRTYFAFLGKKVTGSTNEEFIELSKRFFQLHRDNIALMLNPEKGFKFSKKTNLLCLELMDNLVQKNQIQPSKHDILNVFASAIQEAFDYIRLSPSLNMESPRIFEQITLYIQEIKNMENLLCRMKKVNEKYLKT